MAAGRKLTGDLAQTSVGASGSELQTLGLMDWEITFKLKTVDATTTDDSAWESSLPSSASWTATAKFCYLDGDTSQETNVRATIGQAERTAVKWNFFTDPTPGIDSYTGTAFIDSIKFGAGTGKLVGMDVTLKGTGPLTIVPTLATASQPNTITGIQAED